MPDLIIKPKNQSGSKLILQDQAGGAVLTTADSGVTAGNTILATKTGTETLTNKTLTSPTITGAIATTFARWSDFNDHGSSSTKIMKWSDEDIPATNSTVVTVTNSSTTGFSVEANMDCFLFFHYCIDWASAHYFGISKNSNQVTTAIQDITKAHLMMLNFATAIHVTNEVSWSGELASGDVIRPHSGGAASGGNPTRSYVSVFAMKKI